jgi:hypothetical protein
MADVNVAASSAVEETGNALDSFSDAQRSEWLLKGTPMPKDEAESAPVAASEAAKPEAIAPAPDTGKPQESKSRGEQRKSELGSEIQELLRKRAEIRAEIEAATAGKPAAKPAESAPAKPAQAATTTADGEPAPPDPAKWTGTWEELEAAKIKYVRDLTLWQLGKADRDRAAAEQQTKATVTQMAYRARADAMLAVDPEFADAQEIIGRFVTAKGVSELILDSDVGPEVVMHLYRLPAAEQQRVAALSPLALAREISRIEKDLSKPAAAAAAAAAAIPPPKRTSAAAKPATELGANAGTTVDEAEKALADGDVGRYIDIMNARAIKKN